MKSFRILMILTAVFVSWFHTAISNDVFSLKEVHPVILEVKGKEIFQYWDLKNDSGLWRFTLGKVEALNLYKDSLRAELGEEIFAKAVKKESTQSIETQITIDSTNGDQMNSLLVHSGSLGIIRNINYLEAQLLNYQSSKYPLFSHPTEFHGFILINDSLNLVRVYFASSDQPWPPKPNIILDEMEQDLKNGWKFKYHLHNHYEPKSNNYIGIMAPSLADAQYYKMLFEEFNLEKALITNGFNTVEIRNDEFYKFKSH